MRAVERERGDRRQPWTALRWPIRLQLAIPFAATILAALVAVTIIDAHLAAARSERQIVSHLAQVVRSLATARFPLNDHVLSQMRALSGAEFVVVDAGGRQVASSMPRSAEPLPPGASAAVDWTELASSARVAFGGRAFYHRAVHAALPGPSAEPAVLHVLYAVDALDRTRFAAALPPLIVGTVALFVAIIVAALAAARLSGPIRQVSARVERIAKGDFTPLDLPPNNDEIRDLVVTVNDMARQLDSMQSAVRRSERLNLLGRLAGGLAHTMRNHVTGARMAVELHERRCTADVESLAVARRQLELTEEQLQRFLATGRPEPPRTSLVDLSAVARDVVALVDPACRHRRVTLRARPELWDTIELMADAEQIRQLLLNLLLNAIEAAGPGGWIDLRLDRRRERVSIQVLDSGPGVAPEAAANLFEPFATTKHDGIGLGLAVARQVALAHGGDVEYRRTDGVTCFEAWLAGATAATDRAPPNTDVSHTLSHST